MAISRGIFSPGNTLRPGLACEITPNGVLAARRTEDEQAVMAFVPLAPGVVTGSLENVNFSDAAQVVAAIRTALDEVAAREKQMTLVFPDAAARVLILDFDTLPAKAQDALPIVRFRLRKLAPFEVDDAAVSYQVIRQQREQTRVLVTVMPAAIRAEYENAVRGAGYEPGVMLPSTLASLAVLAPASTALVVNRNGLSLTSAIVDGDELLLYRTQELRENEFSQHEEMAQSVAIAQAYFEDTLQRATDVLYCSGPGGVEHFAEVLGAHENELRLRDLAPVPSTGTMNAIPPGLIAGVMGALTNG